MFRQSRLHSLLVHSVETRCIGATRRQYDPDGFGKSRLIGDEPEKRSNRRFGSLSAHVASLCCISLIIKGLHLIGSGSLHSKLIELSSFAM